MQGDRRIERVYILSIITMHTFFFLRVNLKLQHRPNSVGDLLVSNIVISHELRLQQQHQAKQQRTKKTKNVSSIGNIVNLVDVDILYVEANIYMSQNLFFVNADRMQWFPVYKFRVQNKQKNNRHIKFYVCSCLHFFLFFTNIICLAWFAFF